MPNEQLVSQYGEFMRSASLSQRMKDTKAQRQNLRKELGRYSTESPLILPAKSQIEVTEIQTRLGAMNARYARLVNARKYRAKHGVSYEDEVSKILAMPGVMSMHLNGAKAIIGVSPRYWYFGACYDLGDWLILLDNSKGSFDTHEVRPGFREGWPHGQEPGFCLDYDRSEPHRFCFGTNFGTVGNFVEAGRIVEALSVIVACMHTVDEADQPTLKYTYETVS